MNRIKSRLLRTAANDFSTSKQFYQNFGDKWAENCKRIKNALNDINSLKLEMDNWNLLEIDGNLLVKEFQSYKGYESEYEPPAQISEGTDALPQVHDMKMKAKELMVGLFNLEQLIKQKKPYAYQENLHF